MKKSKTFISVDTASADGDSTATIEWEIKKGVRIIKKVKFKKSKKITK